MIAASSLWAIANGTSCKGEHQCFWCGAPASSPFKPGSGFTAWRDVYDRHSKYRCVGCELSQNERITLEGYEKKQKIRNFSWLITREKVSHFSKSHIARIREILLDPPKDEWAFAISTSGQKPIIYKTPVNKKGASRFTVQLEEIQVHYSISELEDALNIATRISAIIGKKSLTEPLAFSRYRLLREASQSELSEWWDNYLRPICKLVAFITPSKKEAEKYAAKI